jgi:hypothetical protein
VVAFLIFPTQTNNFNVDSLKGQAVTKQLRYCSASYQTTIYRLGIEIRRNTTCWIMFDCAAQIPSIIDIMFIIKYLQKYDTSILWYICIHSQNRMVWKPGKLQSHKIEDLYLMLNRTSPCTNTLSQLHLMLFVVVTCFISAIPIKLLHLPWGRSAPTLRIFAPPLEKVSMTNQSENLTFFLLRVCTS